MSRQRIGRLRRYISLSLFRWRSGFYTFCSDCSGRPAQIMQRFIEGEERNQVRLFPVCVEDYVGEGNPVRVVDVFVD